MKKIFKVILCFLLLILSAATAVYAEQEPIPVGFWKSGGGQYIYCNNPEYIHSWQVSTDENPYASYMMKCGKLSPDRYAVFFCFYNSCSFDIEPDMEFVSDNAIITINSIGYYLPQNKEYWDCLGAWSDLMDIKIRTLDEYRQYVPYAPLANEFPKTLRLSECNEWISNYIYNYDVVRPNTTFNMLVDFTIDEGEAEVNFTALKHYGTLRDRTHHDPNAQSGSYFRDTSVKGIEPDTLAMVETTLDVVVDSSTKDGEPVNVKVFNQFYPDGHIMPHWMTNINPAKDLYKFSKTVAAGSDMLSLHYRDDSKLSYYGSDIPESERNNEWIFDIYHHDTQEYEEGMPWDENAHQPNAFTGKTLDKNNLPNVEWELNLGNFGVVTRYHLSVTNNDTRLRYLNYMLDTTQASNIVIVRDNRGNMLNPYTLKSENAYALSKGIVRAKKEDCMLSVPAPAGKRVDYIIDVILPTNCFGGMLHSLVIDRYGYMGAEAQSEFPEYTHLSSVKNTVFFNGQENMKWENGRLYEESGGVYHEVPLPLSAQTIFGSRCNDYRLIKTNDGYAARYSGWDEYHPDYIGDGAEKNMLYVFDKQMNFVMQSEMIGYISDFSFWNGILYIDCGKRYSAVYYSTDGGRTTAPIQGNKTLPITNGSSALTTSGSNVYARDAAGIDRKISYENDAPTKIIQAGDIFYCVKSWRTYYDESVPNKISVSRDGLRWYDIVLPELFLELKSVSHIGNRICVDCKYQTFEYDDACLAEDEIKVILNGEYLAFDSGAEISGRRTMVPMRYFFEKLGAAVDWNGELGEITVKKDDSVIVMRLGENTASVDGKSVMLDAPPYVKNDKTMIPLRFLSETLGYSVKWDEKTSTAEINTDNA